MQLEPTQNLQKNYQNNLPKTIKTFKIPANLEGYIKL